MFGSRRTYLDNAAGLSGNASSPHAEGRRARQTLEEARVAIARLVEAQADDVLFISGATEANALAILGTVRALRAAGAQTLHVLYLPSAHVSLVENAKLLTNEGVVVEPLPITDWRVDCEALEKLIRPETALVTMEAVCGETGTVWNTRDVAVALKKRAPAARLHVDASQAPATEKLSRAHFGADLLTLDSSKVSAARGIGALVAHRTIAIDPLYRGGGQERGIRPGSESPALAQEFAAALGAAADDRETFRTVSGAIRSELVAALLHALPDVQVNESESQAPHILNLSLLGRDTDYLVALLDEAGFAVSTKSACETDSETGSRAVLVLTGDPVRARSTLRISWGKDFSRYQARRFAKALKEAVVFVDSHSCG